AEATRIGGAKNFFSCGPAVSSGQLHQSIQLLGRNAQIDGELLYVKVKARIATYDSQQDWGQIIVIFQDADFGILKATKTPQVTASNDRFQKVSFSAVVPAGTRFVLFELYAGRPGAGATDYCDAYFDNVSMTLNQL